MKPACKYCKKSDSLTNLYFYATIKFYTVGVNIVSHGV